MMGINNFNLTPRAKKAYKSAKEFAAEYSHGRINNSHLFYGCLLNLSEDLTMMLEINEIIIEDIDFKSLIIKYAKNNPDEFYDEIFKSSWHKETETVISYAQKLSEVYEHDYIGIEHIFYSILENSDEFCAFLSKENIDTNEFKKIIKSHIESFCEVEKLPQEKNTEPKEVSKLKNQEPKKKTKPFEKYCTFLNVKALSGAFNNISGRDKEINELIEILSKKVKSNAILIGEGGVGKTAIIEGLAQRVINNNVPANLLNAEIYSVDLASMISGTRYRGEFEERFKELIEAASEHKNIILFFDEIHNIVGAGSSEGSLDASNMLKPALARGNFKCIGATTTNEYKKYFEKDGAMKRRFDAISIEAPSKKQTKEIISNCIEDYELFHHVQYPSKVIDAIIDLCDSYIPHKNFPDKAFDIVDLVGARVKIKNIKLPDEVQDLQNYLMKKLLRDEPFNDEEDEFTCENALISYVEKIKIFNEDLFKKKFTIKLSDVIEVISEKSGLSKNSISININDFSTFQENIEKEVFGQSKNIEQITDILSCAKVGLNDPNKPLCSLFFVGPTSVGKTYTAKKIAKHFYGNEKAFIQINMSEYQEKTGISKLIGANAGYVGFEQGGLLTEFVRSNPNCVVLFDEVEKCDPEILNLLLHLLDEGYVNDNLNNKISFTNSIVILTSNIGHDKKEKKSMGFINDVEEPETIYQDAVKKYLKPEFVARINNILVFNELSSKELESIVSVEIKNIQEKLKEKNIKINFHPSTKESILNKIKIDKLHARNIKDLVRSEFQVPISKFIIKNSKNQKISVKIIDNKLKIS